MEYNKLDYIDESHHAFMSIKNINDLICSVLKPITI